MSCLHPPVSAEHSDQWWRIEPENTLTGVSYRNGGGWWKGEREPLGFTVQHAGHWIFDGTGLRDGDVFGAAERLVGYECDGVALAQLPDGVLVPDGSDGTPSDFVVLGHARLGPDWQDRPRGADAVATMGLHTPGGTIFTCGTTDWSRLLASGHLVVERITSNVVRQLAAPTLRISGPSAENDTDDDAATLHVGAGVAARAVTFHVRGSRAGAAERYRWTYAVGSSAAQVLDARGPATTVAMPPDPALVTVTVTVTDDSKLTRAFGTKTVRVVSVRDAAQVALLSELLALVLAVVPALSPTQPVGEGNRPFGDARWNALRDGLRAKIDRETAHSARTTAVRLLARIDRLID